VDKAKGFTAKPNMNDSKRLVARYAPAGVLSACLGMACNSVAQTNEEIKLGTAPDIGAAALAGEVKASQYVSDPGAPYENYFRNFDAGLGASPKLGPGRATVGLGPFNLSPGVNTPVNRGFRPEDSELKIGNFYLDIKSLRGSLLFSDNVNLTENNRKSDVTGSLALGLRALYQLNDGLQFAVEGDLVYLPFENRAGVNGFGLIDPFAKFALNGNALFRTQISYDFKLMGWDFTVFDNFEIRNNSLYRLGEGDFLDLYDGESFRSERSFAGRQATYTPSANASGGFRDDTNSAGSFDASALDYVNRAGVIATRLVPTVSRATLSYHHENVWYSSSSTVNGVLVPDYQRDLFVARLESVRENLRFKPYIQYRASTYSTVDGWDQELLAGIKGPITDQLEFLGEGGYVWSDNSGSSATIWSMRLTHDAGPYTRQSAGYFRSVTEPDRQLRETYSYQIAQILGPYLTGGFYYAHNKFGDLDTKNTFVEEDVFGTYLNWDLAKFGTVSFMAFHTITDYTNPATPDATKSTLRMLYSAELSPKLHGTFVYQFQKRDSEAVGQDYYENLVAISLIRSF
jgi:hypothetical protein